MSRSSSSGAVGGGVRSCGWSCRPPAAYGVAGGGVAFLRLLIDIWMRAVLMLVHFDSMLLRGIVLPCPALYCCLLVVQQHTLRC